MKTYCKPCNSLSTAFQICTPGSWQTMFSSKCFLALHSFFFFWWDNQTVVSFSFRDVKNLLPSIKDTSLWSLHHKRMRQNAGCDSGLIEWFKLYKFTFQFFEKCLIHNFKYSHFFLIFKQYFFLNSIFKQYSILSMVSLDGRSFVL